MRRSEASRTILIGAAGGALVGVLLALLYGRWQQRRGPGAKPIQPAQVVRLGTALVPVVRQIIDLLSGK
jgi:NhaP-type Na+/H+ or K+/H+ antiporter